MFSVRLFDKEKDYEVVKEWAVANKQILPHWDCLPGVGSLVELDGKPAGCGFLYLDNETPVSVLEWVYVDPMVRPRNKIKVLEMVITSLERCAEVEEAPLMFAGSPSSGITKIYKRLGWSVAIENVTHMVKNIQLQRR